MFLSGFDKTPKQGDGLKRSDVGTVKKTVLSVLTQIKPRNPRTPSKAGVSKLLIEDDGEWATWVGAPAGTMKPDRRGPGAKPAATL